MSNTSSILWSDRLRHLGLPISFTKYSITEDRLFRETGLYDIKSLNLISANVLHCNYLELRYKVNNR